MANISTHQRSAPAVYSPGQSLCIIVGLACLAGFALDLLILALPPDLFNIQWRIGLLQKVGDRSIVLLFGLALMMYGCLANRAFRKQLALLCLVIGIMFSASGVVMVRDSLKLQDITLVNIAIQEDQVRTQIQSARENPQELAPELTPEALDQAAQQLSQSADTAKQNARTSLTKIGASSLGNLIVSGIALIALGRFGNRAV